MYTSICDGSEIQITGPEESLQRLAAHFDNAIKRQEELIIKDAFRFDDETEEEFNAKIQRRISKVCMGVGSAQDFPGITAICPGQNAVWNSFRINRRRVDQLDNIYISRA